METTVNRVYTRNIIKILETEDLVNADEIMNNHNIRHLPVVDKDNYLVGLLSKSDFNALRYMNSRFKGFKVKDLMSSPVKVVNPSTKVSDVADLMMAHKISCVLIAKDDELMGILTTDDLLRLLLSLTSSQERLGEIDLASLADEGWVSATFN